MTVADEVITILSNRGQSSYFGEPVSQLEHALQSAHFAHQEEASDHLVLAALVHDIGHLVEDNPENIADLGVDAKHEETGQSWLAQRFGPEVYEPVHLHVAAKRYLCATDADYLLLLSPASVQSLQLQGGPMLADEITTFETNPYFRDAVRLRRWDDEAKVPGLATADLLSHYNLIQRVSLSKHTV